MQGLRYDNGFAPFHGEIVRNSQYPGETRVCRNG
jgi:hypothetical protein